MYQPIYPSNAPRPPAEVLPTMYDLPSEDPEELDPLNAPRPPAEVLPTMYDLPSEDPEEPGLPDEFHDFQPKLLRETYQPVNSDGDPVFIGADLNLYYDVRHPRWYKRPDWFLVLGVISGTQQSDLRLSYVTWQEGVAPFLVVELLSPGTEAEDLGQTLREVNQLPTKWQVYEQILRIPYYVVFDRYTLQLRLFRLVATQYEELRLVDRRYWFEELQLGLGVWSGRYSGVEGQWLRWYDGAGHWLATAAERAEQEAQRAEQAVQLAEQEAQRAEQATQRAERLAERLRSLGLDPDQIEG
jgi:Uma2 family endonuclease